MLQTHTYRTVHIKIITRPHMHKYVWMMLGWQGRIQPLWSPWFGGVWSPCLAVICTCSIIEIRCICWAKAVTQHMLGQSKMLSEDLKLCKSLLKPCAVKPHLDFCVNSYSWIVFDCIVCIQMTVCHIFLQLSSVDSDITHKWVENSSQFMTVSIAATFLRKTATWKY